MTHSSRTFRSRSFRMSRRLVCQIHCITSLTSTKVESLSLSRVVLKHSEKPAFATSSTSTSKKKVLFSAPWRRKTSSREENFISLAGRLAFGSVFDGFRPSITCHKIDLNCFINAARRSARQCVFSSSFGDHSKVMDEN